MTPKPKGCCFDPCAVPGIYDEYCFFIRVLMSPEGAPRDMRCKSGRRARDRCHPRGDIIG